MNTHPLTLNKGEFISTHHRTGRGRNAIFQDRKALMTELYESGVPIYCDQTYYVNEQTLHLVVRNGEHFQCDRYTVFEEWRDCHYYSEWEDKDGNKVWFMTGGRYD